MKNRNAGKKVPVASLRYIETEELHRQSQFWKRINVDNYPRQSVAFLRFFCTAMKYYQQSSNWMKQDFIESFRSHYLWTEENTRDSTFPAEFVQTFLDHTARTLRSAEYVSYLVHAILLGSHNVIIQRYTNNGRLSVQLLPVWYSKEFGGRESLKLDDISL